MSVSFENYLVVGISSRALFNLEKENEVFEKDSIVLAVTVNGKKRCEIEVPLNSSNEEVLLIAKESAKKWLENSTIIKEIVVPNKLVNIVIKA